MANTLVWNGLDEYLAELRRLPADCTTEAAKLVEGAVNGAYVTISQVYGAHRHTGTLQKRLKVTPLRQRGLFVAGLQLTSGSPIAWLFDNGSQVRHHAGGKGVGAMWGNTPNPPTHIFSRTVGNAKRRLAQQYREMLLRRGAVRVTEAA